MNLKDLFGGKGFDLGLLSLSGMSPSSSCLCTGGNNCGTTACSKSICGAAGGCSSSTCGSATSSCSRDTCSGSAACYNGQACSGSSCQTNACHFMAGTGCTKNQQTCGNAKVCGTSANNPL